MQTAPTARASEIELNEVLLRAAVIHERPVAFSYSKSDSSPIERRRIRPTSVAISDDEARLVVGEDSYRSGESRSFRIDRIKGTVQVLDA